MNNAPRAVLVAVLVGALSTAWSCRTASPAARPGVPSAGDAAPHLIDLMPAFWGFWARAEGKSPAGRIALLKDIALAPHREFYEKVVTIPSDERLGQFLETLSPAVPALRRIDGEFHAQLPGAYASFIATWPDLDRSLPIYVGPSLFTSSGQVRDLDGRTIVFYGLDVVAVVLPDVTNHVPDIQHELFHAYHWQRNAAAAAAGRQSFSETRTTPMYDDLWAEGLALHAVRRMNPDAPLALLLSSPELAEKGPAVLARVAGELRQRLDVTDLKEVGDYFFFRTSRKDLPPRIAYYVGLRLAEQVGRRLSMDEMIRLEGEALRREIDRGLAELESAG
jgi:hypothetical protein